MLSTARASPSYPPRRTIQCSLFPSVEQVGAIGMTVSDMDASIDFYSKVLSFEKVSDVEVTGEDYERSARSLWPAHARGANAPG